MYFEITSNEPLRFAVQDLTQEEAVMLADALVEIKTKRFADSEKFEYERGKCVEMYSKINKELIVARRNLTDRLNKLSRLSRLHFLAENLIPSIEV